MSFKSLLIYASGVAILYVGWNSTADATVPGVFMGVALALVFVFPWMWIIERSLNTLLDFLKKQGSKPRKAVDGVVSLIWLIFIFILFFIGPFLLYISSKYLLEVFNFQKK